jgi:hypothetical protein
MAMKFDLMGIVLMIIAIAVGQFIGSYLVGYLGGLGGGIIGSLIVGAVIYVIYTFATRGKFTLVHLIIFSILIYVANLVAGYFSVLFGLGGGYITLIIAGVLMAFLWGWVGGQGKGKKTKIDGIKI